MDKFSQLMQKNIVLNTLIKNYPYAIVYKDKNFKTLYVNDLLCAYFGISAPSNVIGTPCISFLSDENKKVITELENRIKKEKRQLNFKILEQNGKKMKTFHLILTPVLQNNKFEGVIYTINDITREENLKNKLRIKHNQIRVLLENVPLLIYLKDRFGKFIAGSKMAREFVQEGKDGFHNLHINKLTFQDFAGDDDKYVLENNNLIVKEIKVADISGSSHWYKIYKVPINNHDNVTGMVTIAKNIDATKQLESQRETFVTSLGHDLKNPTIAQIRAIELLLKGEFGEVTPEQREILEMISDSCKYMKAMLSSLLATYRNLKGKIKLANDNFSLTELTEECIEEMVYIAKDKNIKISLSKICDNDTVCGDKIQMKRVIMNLLSNGIKYAFSNTTLNIKVYKENLQTCFMFENASPYISPQRQETIFAQYVSFAEAQQELGIGLGLYASKKIVEAHGGEIFVQSFKENKNIFGFKIPDKTPNKERVVVF